MVAALLVGIEGTWRGLRGARRGPLAGGLDALLLFAVGITCAGGLGLLVGGARPAELLHFVYAALGLGIVPVAGALSRGASPRTRGGATVLAALVLLVVIVRLFQTG